MKGALDQDLDHGHSAWLGKRRGSAEEPVTARICCQMETMLASDPSIDPATTHES